MTSEQSKPVALDARELHSLLCMFGRYGPAVALGFIAMLSVWAVFIVLYRTVRGQRRKKNENAVREAETKQSEIKARSEESRFCTESTENIKEKGEEAFKSKDSSAEGPGEVAPLLRKGKWSDPCVGVHDELDLPDTEECHSASDAHDSVSSHCSRHQEHADDRTQNPNRYLTYLHDHSVHNDHSEYVNQQNLNRCGDDRNKHEADCSDQLSAYPSNHKEHAPNSHNCLGKHASKPEVQLSRSHQNMRDHQEPLRNHCDYDIKTEKMTDTNINSQLEVNSGGLCIMEATMNNSDEYLHDCHQEAGITQHEHSDPSEGLHGDAGFEKKVMNLDNDRSGCMEETLKITEVNLMDTTVENHQEGLMDHKHLSVQHEGLSACHHGLPRHHHEDENGHLQPVPNPAMEKPAVTTEREANRLGSSMDRSLEESCSTAEINIMEATMDNNEWMNASSLEIRKEISFPGLSLFGDVELEEQCLGETEEAALARNDISKGVGTTALLDGDPSSKRVVAVPPIPQTVGVSFRIHYITHTPLQVLAVTGNQEELGSWENFVPLKRAEDGFWASSVALPVDCHVEWKFVLVENGKIRRWEECDNRHLQTGYEDVIHLHEWWGCL